MLKEGMESYPLGGLKNGLDKVHKHMSGNHSAAGQIHREEAIGHFWPQTLAFGVWVLPAS